MKPPGHGDKRHHIIWHVLLPEALPGIVGGFTITLVTMINSSAMAGAIGAGGLGDIAYRYGYQRFDSQVMLTVIVSLVILVSWTRASWVVTAWPCTGTNAEV